MRGGEAPRAPEGRPRRGRGGSGPPVSPGLPPPVLLRLGSRVRGGGPGAWPAGGAGARGRPCRCRRGRSRPRPRTEPGRPVAGPAGRRTGGARAGCGRERGHCVPHPPSPRGVTAQTRFPRRDLVSSPLSC